MKIDIIYLKKDWKMNKESYELLLFVTRIFQRAVKKAQQRHRDNNIPNVYCRNGEIIWEMPDGTYTKEDPFLKEKENIKS